MPHPTDGKPNTMLAPGRLAHFQLLEARGRDAASFLQAQTMNDVGALADGQWQWNGLLSAKGRVLALFALLRLEGERFWLLLPDVPADAVAAMLRRYVFRAKVQLEPLAARFDAVAGGPFEEPRQAAPDGAGWQLDMGSAPHPRLLRVAALEPTADDEAADVHARTAAWRWDDLAFGLPRLAPDQGEQYTPQMLSLQRLDAFSLTKGCYPGQEIVARTHYLGQARRTLHLYSLAAPCATADEVAVADTVVGQVACVAGNGAGEWLALAVTAEAEGAVRIGSAEAQPLPIRPGLGRGARAS